MRYILGQGGLNLIVGCLNVMNLLLCCVCMFIVICVSLSSRHRFVYHWLFFFPFLSQNDQVWTKSCDVLRESIWLSFCIILYLKLSSCVLLCSFWSVSDLRGQVIHYTSSGRKAERREKVINGRTCGSQRSFDVATVFSWSGEKAKRTVMRMILQFEEQIVAMALAVPLTLQLSLYSEVQVN